MSNAKIIVDYLDKNGSLSREIVWGKKFENDKYYIKNIPFFAPNISFDDLIEVDNEEGSLYFNDLVEPSNNSTLRIIFFEDDSKSIYELLRKIESYLAEWEGLENKPYYAINVPKNVNYKVLKNFLDEYEVFFDYEESCLSEKH
ncbi:DUF4265 domain-containing protein [Acinetobacter haemolyticus]|nr:DUF4265 domain-containing protein [Acinetobacter haemolyticus]RSC80276.1 DUF4265 domain-containing protein [Acinetobacter haemolyticus]